jgi:uncharacterized membrane protein YdjX (TVP38/TMEM64 family)
MISNQPKVPTTAAPVDDAARRSRWIVPVVLLIAALAIGFTFLPVKEWLKDFRDQIKALGAVGFFAYIALYVVCASCLIPCTAMGLLAGYLFGLSLGVPAAVIGGNLGAWSAFFLGRTLLRGRVETWAADRPRFSAVERAVAQNAMKIIVCLRLSPIFGYTLMNYLLALTSVPFWKFALATVIGMLPGNFAFVYLGTLPDELQQDKPLGIRVLQIAGIAATLLATVLISRIARRALREANLGAK